MKKAVFILLIACLSIVSFQSCHKSNSDDNSDMRHVQLSNLFETLSNDVFKTSLYGVMAANDSLYHPNESTNYRLNDSCISFSLTPFDETSWPKTLHLNFSGNGQCNDGISRAGEIIIEITGPMFQINSKYIINFNNYSIDSNIISGNKKIYITTGNFSFADTTAMQINSNTPVMECTSTHNIQWALGNSTLQDISDDLFLYNGKASCIPLSGNSSDEMSFNANITKALQFRNYCYWIGSGKTEIIPSGLSIRTVTYLDSCVNQAMVTIDNDKQYVNF